MFVEAIKQGSSETCILQLARVLAEVLDRLHEPEASRICEELVASLKRDALEVVAPELLSQLMPEKAHALAWDLASSMAATSGFDTDLFARILSDTGRKERAGRAALMAKAGAGVEGVAEAAVRVWSKPFPCRLTTPELVELLKMPTCFGRRGGLCSTTSATATVPGSSTTGRRPLRYRAQPRPRPHHPAETSGADRGLPNDRGGRNNRPAGFNRHWLRT